MFNDILLTFRLRNTYTTNSVLHSFQTIPVVGKYLTNDIYSEPVFKVLGYILSFIINVFIKTIGVIGLYIYFLIFMYALGLEHANSHMLMLFLLDSLFLMWQCPIGIEMKKDSAYAVLSMNMNAKRYVIAKHIADTLKLALGYIPFLLIGVSMYKINILYVPFMFIFMIATKLIRTRIEIFSFEHEIKRPRSKSWFIRIFIGVIVIAYYFMVAEMPHLYINIHIVQGLYILFIILGLLSIRKIVTFNKWYPLYKKLHQRTLEERESIQNDVKATSSYIKNDPNITSNKDGYGYFHELFVKRHKNVLYLPVLIASGIVLVIFMVWIATILKEPDSKESINYFILGSIRFWPLIICFANRGQKITKAMFNNCDIAMLKYRFYRTPKVIFGLFKERLLTIFKLNMIPSSLIAIGIPIMIYLSGGADFIYYIIYPIAIISITLFFSAHYLVLYYLIQPFSLDSESKNKLYSLIIYATYYLAYIPTTMEINAKIFTIIWLVFGILYSLIGLLLAYKLAPKTFKLRL